MDLPSIRPAVKSLVARLVELPVAWLDEPRPITPPGVLAICLLSLRPNGSLGWDECRREFDANQAQGSEFADRIMGQRKATLTVRVESLTQTDPSVAANYLERVRDRLARRSSREALNAVGCAYVNDLGIVDLTTTFDGRRFSTAAIDIVLAVRVSELDPDRYGYIDTVDVSGPTSPV